MLWPTLLLTQASPQIPMDIQKHLEEVKPSLKEWAWILSNGKDTEAHFVDDMCHRLEILLSLIKEQTRREDIDIVKSWKNEGDQPTETDLVLENIITNLEK